MYTISKQFNFSASHIIEGLPEQHPCSRLHGHNYVVELVLAAEELNATGFVVDYNDLAVFKTMIDETLDHRHLNDVLTGPTTAESIAKYLYDHAKHIWHEVISVSVSETPKTNATYRP
ncbi:6-pyruvoyl tetrahydrobiopterin synthase [Methyloprofundus sedimenti]|uniref:6-carboxy-5,6,7,8-tetrahydropterin synthase n=1 Tax=Methyloprofundus sedimenti TaxID=1420851 RepID=A0A1V8M8M0_9GAMM|nr:6-carboxytetrahydropterin synthase [Methyloprofundus sedimenti]OQK17858.1 6-pyruvoyl tetrahydrobiopterin synthase [Methyloprofundus sedimenti]